MFDRENEYFLSSRQISYLCEENNVHNFVLHTTLLNINWILYKHLFLQEVMEDLYELAVCLG
jgi:hypothetical protein